MSKINEIVADYTSGKTPVEETNAALKAAGAGFSFRPGQNALTPEEIAETRVGDGPEDATGWGILDDGISPSKIHIVDGKVASGPINSLDADGHPCQLDIVRIGGQTWQVYGDTLGELEEEPEPWWVPYHTFTGAVDWRDELAKYIPSKDMMFDRPKYHGVEVVRGALRYLYAEDGTCQYQPKSMFQYDKDHGRA